MNFSAVCNALIAMSTNKKIVVDFMTPAGIDEPRYEEGDSQNSQATRDDPNLPPSTS